MISSKHVVIVTASLFSAQILSKTNETKYPTLADRFGWQKSNTNSLLRQYVL
jgi:hypothetical protein